MPGGHFSARKGACVMLMLQTDRQCGYGMLEALVACSLTIIASVGLWKLICATRHLARESLHETQLSCETPQCSDLNHTTICVCGDRRMVILR